MVNIVLFAVFPYVAVVLAVVVGTYRYMNDRFSYSSFSSQLLENRSLFWGSVPWHYAVILVLLAHTLALLLPGVWAQLIAEPTRLYVLEVIGLALALSALLGLLVLFVRRLTNARIRSVTSVMDWVLLVTLVVQIALGFLVALFFRWGSDWYLHTSVPWLISLVQLNPQTEFVTSLGAQSGTSTLGTWIIRTHLLGGFMLIALFPFTRLVHIVTVPITYLWRPYQVVIWNKRYRRAS